MNFKSVYTCRILYGSYPKKVGISRERVFLKRVVLLMRGCKGGFVFSGLINMVPVCSDGRWDHLFLVLSNVSCLSHRRQYLSNFSKRQGSMTKWKNEFKQTCTRTNTIGY